MKLLIDTNIILEIILDQEKAKEATALLVEINKHDFFISDYSFHSLGTILFRQKKHRAFQQFVDDMLIRAGMTLISLSVEDMPSVMEAARKFRLDFDDAYQCVVAGKETLTMVSYDSDFDRTEHGRKRPADIASNLT